MQIKIRRWLFNNLWEHNVNNLGNCEIGGDGDLVTDCQTET